MPKAWTIRFGRTIASQIVDDVGARLEGAGANHVTVGGISLMGVLGLHGRVLEPTGDGGLALNLRTDAMWVGTEIERTTGMVATEADASRLRLILEAQRAYDLDAGAI